MFRKQALDRLSSPEQLDQLVALNTPMGWAALAAVGALLAGAVAWMFLGHLPDVVRARGLLLAWDTLREVSAPLDGELHEIRVKRDEEVRRGDVVAIVRSGGVDTEVTAKQEGFVAQLPVRAGESVRSGDAILHLSSTRGTLRAVLFLPADEGKRVHVGMAVHLLPTTVSESRYGYLLGTVSDVDDFPAPHSRLLRLLGSEELAQSFEQGMRAPLRVDVALSRDPDTASGYRWSTGGGPPITLSGGTICSAAVVLGQVRPFELMGPLQKE